MKKEETEVEKIIRERREKKQAKILEDDKKKYTHDWHKSNYIDRISGALQPQTSHCKKCGVNYYLFKANPQYCPK